MTLTLLRENLYWTDLTDIKKADKGSGENMTTVLKLDNISDMITTHPSRQPGKTLYWNLTLLQLQIFTRIFTRETTFVTSCLLSCTPNTFLTLSMLWANSADDTLMIFFLIFPRKQVWHFMQIVSNGDNLHGLSNPVFWENIKKKYFKMLSAEIFTQHAKS